MAAPLVSDARSSSRRLPSGRRYRGSRSGGDGRVAGAATAAPARDGTPDALGAGWHPAATLAPHDRKAQTSPPPAHRPAPTLWWRAARRPAARWPAPRWRWTRWGWPSGAPSGGPDRRRVGRDRARHARGALRERDVRRGGWLHGRLPRRPCCRRGGRRCGRRAARRRDRLGRPGVAPRVSLKRRLHLRHGQPRPASA